MWRATRVNADPGREPRSSDAASAVGSRVPEAARQRGRRGADKQRRSGAARSTALGQSLHHWELCALLGFLIRGVTAPEHNYGADQFVDWNPREPRRCLAADGFVKLGVAFELVDSWKTWERGVPELVAIK